MMIKKLKSQSKKFNSQNKVPKFNSQNKDPQFNSQNKEQPKFNSQNKEPKINSQNKEPNLDHLIVNSSLSLHKILAKTLRQIYRPSGLILLKLQPLTFQNLASINKRSRTNRR